jgi:hypothetical protein
MQHGPGWMVCIFNGIAIQDPRRNAVRVAETDDGGSGGAIETQANNEIFISALHAENCGQDGIYVDHPTQSIRDLNIQGEVIGSGVAGYYAVNSNAALARYVQPSIVQLKHRNFAAGMTNLATSGNWKTRDIFGSTY